MLIVRSHLLVGGVLCLLRAHTGREMRQNRVAHFCFCIDFCSCGQHGDQNFSCVQTGSVHRFLLPNKGKFGGICAKILKDYDCDCMFGCEVGGHKQGLLEEMCVEDVFSMGEDIISAIPARFLVDAKLNALSVFNGQALSWNPEIPHMHLLLDPTVITLSNADLDPQLVVSSFETTRYVATCHLIVGNLHVRTPFEYKDGTNIPQRLRMVKEAMRQMERMEQIIAKPNCTLVLLGDFHLIKIQDEDAAQKFKQQPLELNKQWHVQTSMSGKRGDLLFVNGAKSCVFDIPIGASYASKGMCNDVHDAFGVTLVIRTSNAVTWVSQPWGAQSSGRRKGLKLSHQGIATKQEAEAQSSQTKQETVKQKAELIKREGDEFHWSITESEPDSEPSDSPLRTRLWQDVLAWFKEKLHLQENEAITDRALDHMKKWSPSK